MPWTTVTNTNSDGTVDNGSAWRNPIISPSSASYLGVGDAIEDLLVDPEDMTLEPESIQADYLEWTVLPEPD